MNLLKTSFLTGISTIIKIIAGFIITKCVAMYIGPSGLAIVGQFQNFISIITILANGSINGGIIKYTSEYYNDYEKKSSIHSTAFFISIVCAIIVSLAVIIMHKYIAISILKDIKYSSIVLIFGFTLVIFSFNSFLMALLNGHKEIRKYVTVNIVSSIVTLIFTVSLVLLWGLYGALLSAATAQTVVFLVTIFFVLNSEWFNKNDFLKGCNRESLVKLGKFSLMAVVSAIAVPMSQIFIRNLLSDSISLDAAGYCQAVWKISDTYLLLITTSLSVYYLPRLSEIKDITELRKEIFSGYKIIMPIVITLALMIFCFKGTIINILFSDKFLPMSQLFAYQLIGDVIKIFAWLLSYVMVAKAMTRYFIISEIVSTITFIVFSKLLVDNFGLIGVSQAFALNYFLYSLAMMWLFKDLIFGKKVKNA